MKEVMDTRRDWLKSYFGDVRKWDEDNLSNKESMDKCLGI